MEKRTLGRTGMEVSVLGFGGAEIGYGKSAQENVNQLLNAALDAGLNTIDTAECYTAGDDHTSSEELIGAAISHRRDDFFLFTKCGHASGLSGEDWDPKMLAESIDRSLKRLQTDCVDLLQLHSCDAAVLKKGDVIDVLHKARAAGKTRFIGYSGDDADALYAVTSGAFDTLQTSVNIADQSVLDTILPSAKYNDMGVIAKRPLANVVWLPELGGDPPANDYVKPYWERLRVLDYPFLSTPESVAIALRFTLSQPGVHTAIVGTEKPDRWAQNAHLLDAGPLSEDEIEAIRTQWQQMKQADWVGQR